MQQKKVILFRVFDTLPEAVFAKDALEQNGISCFLGNENVNQMYPIFGSAVGGVHLNLFEEDADRARDILDGLYCK